MTDENLKRGTEIKEEIRLCKSLLSDLKNPKYGWKIITTDDERNDREEPEPLVKLLRPDLIELLRAKISALTFEFNGL